MQVVKKTDEYTILKRGDGRYAVRGDGRAFVHGEEKAKILEAAGLISLSPKKAPEPEPEPAEDAAGETAEAPSEGSE